MISEASKQAVSKIAGSDKASKMFEPIQGFDESLLKESWKPITGTNERYWVSSKGAVKSYSRNPKGIILKPRKVSLGGYLAVWMPVDDIHHTTVLIHRLVAEAFVPNPKKYHYVTHKDGDKENNCAWNLQWVRSCGYRAVKCQNVDTGQVYETMTEAAKKEGLSKTSVYRMVQSNAPSVHGVTIRAVE